MPHNYGVPPNTPVSLLVPIDTQPERRPSRFWHHLKSLAAPARPNQNHAKLTGHHLYLAVIALNLVNGIAFVDILGIGVIQSAVSEHYNGQDAVDWNTTSALIGATIGQCLLGYMSDVFTRRKMLLFALLLLFGGAMGCATSSWLDSPGVLVLCRAVCGVATGSISNLVNISQNDICTEEQRLNLQGVQGISVAAGSIIGSVAAALLPHWKYLYFMEAGLSILGITCIWKLVPPNRDVPKRDEIRKEARRVDFLGIVSGIGWLVPGLLLLSRWKKLSTPAIIGLSIATGISVMLFMALGFRKELADDERMPSNFFDRLRCRRSRAIAPFRLFKNRTIGAIYAQNVGFGAAFYSFIYFAPILAQVIRQESAIQGVLRLIPYFLTHAFWSTVSARIIKTFQRRGWLSYSLIMGFGFCCWTVAMALLGWDCTRPAQDYWYAFAALVGLGTGSVFQNSVLAITKQVQKDDKAVALGTRNVLRFLGGAIGTAMSGMIMRTIVRQQLPPELDHYADKSVADHSWFKQISEDQEVLVRDANAKGISVVWYTFAGVLAACVILCALIKDDVSKKAEDEEKKPRPGLDDRSDSEGNLIMAMPLTSDQSRNGSDHTVSVAPSVRNGQSRAPLGWD